MKFKKINFFQTFVYLVLVVIFAFSLFSSGRNEPKEISFTEFAKKAVAGEIKSIETDANSISFKAVGAQNGDSDSFTIKSPYNSLQGEIESFINLMPTDQRTLASSNFSKIEIKNLDPNRVKLFDLFLSFLPSLIILGFIFFITFMLPSGIGRGGENGPGGFKMSAFKLVNPTIIKERFTDVAGCDEAVKELSEVVDFLKDPKKFSDAGAVIPKGVILSGPPGTGKTLLARAVAGEAGVPFFSISGSEFMELFVGVGASRVRDLFKKARKVSPSIVFIDEIDAVGRMRGSGLGGGHDEREQTLNQILVEMDGFEKNSGVIVIAATNREDVLDSALLRPGRFDRRVYVDLPDLAGRVKLFEIYSADKKVSANVNFKTLAGTSAGMSGADIKNATNEAAIMMAQKKESAISQDIFSKAIEKIAMGPEKLSQKVSDQEKQVIAYHEAGHAVVGHILPLVDKVHKITIIGRGPSLGLTWFVPEKDMHLNSRDSLMQKMTSLMAGLAAEKVIFGDYGNGGGGDIRHATSLANAMVTKYGMSQKVGFVFHTTQHGNIYDMEGKSFSEDTARIIDEEIRRIIDECFSAAVDLLQKNVDKLKEVAKELLLKESLDGSEFEKIMSL